MKKTTFKRGSVSGTALRPVPKIALCIALSLSTYLYVNESIELDKAEKEIVQYEKSLKDQQDIIISLNGDKVDLTSKNDKLLKDNAKLNQKLKGEGEKYSKLQQKLKQTELQAEKAEEALRKKQ